VAKTNRQNLVEMLDAVSAELARLRRHIEAGDSRLVELFEEAKSVRDRWANRPRTET
jgi:prephenate dehydrogenase